MDIIINSFLGACGAGLLTILGILIRWIWKKFRIDDQTIKALAHDAYYRNCHQLMPKDEITEEELENHDYLWKAYKGQGLNGTGEKLHEQILAKKVLTSDI